MSQEMLSDKTRLIVIRRFHKWLSSLEIGLLTLMREQSECCEQPAFMVKFGFLDFG